MSKIDIEINSELNFEVGDSVIVIKENGTIGKVIVPEMGIGTTKTAGYKKMLEVIDFVKPGAKKDFAEYNEENLMTLDVRMHGLVAQEVKAALDKTGVERFAGWKEDPDGCQRISKEMFVFPLIKAVQELSAEINKLKEKLNE